VLGEPSHFEIGAPDAGRACEFYAELFGWDFKHTEHGAHVHTQSTPGGIHSQDEPGVQIFFSVSNLESAAKRVVELGGEVDPERSQGPGGNYLHSCRDNQGVPFGLHEPPAS
jgi:predicted enzyme related to lactoylglutathione lyase